MPSNTELGARGKARSRRWLERAGYQVADMELMRTNWVDGRMIPAKRDQWGADLIAKNIHGVVVVQSKALSRMTCAVESRRRGAIMAAVREANAGFAAHRPWPPCVRCVVHVWVYGASAPTEYECEKQ